MQQGSKSFEANDLPRENRVGALFRGLNVLFSLYPDQDMLIDRTVWPSGSTSPGDSWKLR